MGLGPRLNEAVRATTPEALREAAGRLDAVIIGAGAAGSLAALLLCEAGLRVLVLEAGQSRADIDAWAERGSKPPPVGRQAVQARCYAWHLAPQAYVDDLDCPYATPPDRPFTWIRARQLGGRLMVPGHGRQYYRMAPEDLAPQDGLSPPWPVEAAELDRWYDLVEWRIGLAGMNDGLACLPDSVLARVLELTGDEIWLRDAIRARWPAAQAILARFAPPFDALELAAQTGRLMVRSGAIAREIVVAADGHVRGVEWIDRDSAAVSFAAAPLVFACASTLETTRLLMLSRSTRRPGGLGSASDALGRYMMDHVLLTAAARGSQPLSPVTWTTGRCLYLPRFDSRQTAGPIPGRGFGMQIYRWAEKQTGAVNFTAGCFAEMLPRVHNQVTLDGEMKDAWGIPALRIDCAHGHVELARARAQAQALREVCEGAGAEILSLDDTPTPPGSAMHECGTARMGIDPASSVVDANNECWDARGLYVTDGACFPSQGAQNPTLTILALTARACAHALGRQSRP